MRIRGCWDENSYSVISLLLLATTLPQCICNALLNDISPLFLKLPNERGNLECWRHASRPFPILHIPRHQHNAYSFTSIKLSGQVINIKLGQFSYCLLSSLHSVLRSWLSFFLRLLLCLPGLLSNLHRRTHARTPAMPDPAQINRSLGTIKTELEYLANSGVLSPPQLQSIQAQLPVCFVLNNRSLWNAGWR